MPTAEPQFLPTELQALAASPLDILPPELSGFSHSLSYT